MSYLFHFLNIDIRLFFVLLLFAFASYLTSLLTVAAYVVEANCLL